MSAVHSVRAILALAALAPLLAGCGVPDLIAHTVKTIEKNQAPPAQRQTTATSPAPVAVEPPLPAAAPRDGGAGDSYPAGDDTPVYSPPAASAGTASGPITIEELPPR